MPLWEPTGIGTFVPRGGGTTATSMPLPILDVTNYGAKGDGVTDDSLAFAAARADLIASDGGTLLLPPGKTYLASLTLTGNHRFNVSGYGAIWQPPENGTALVVNTAHGGSALSSTIFGIHFKGSANQNSTGVQILDSDRTNITDCSFERLATGLALTTSSVGGTDGTEGTNVNHTEFNNCTIGVDFQPSTGSGFFCETTLWDLAINNCPTGVSAASSAVKWNRLALFATFWVPTNGIAVVANTDLDRVWMRLMGEAYPAATGCRGLQIGASTANWWKADLNLMFQSSIASGSQVDLNGINGVPIVYQNGMTHVFANAGAPASWGFGPSLGSRTLTYPSVGFGYGPSPQPGGVLHSLFMGDGTNIDCIITRTAAKTWGLNADNVIRTGRNTTANRPTAATVGSGSMFFDTTLNKPIWSDGTNWRDATGTIV